MNNKRLYFVIILLVVLLVISLYSSYSISKRLEYSNYLVYGEFWRSVYLTNYYFLEEVIENNKYENLNIPFYNIEASKVTKVISCYQLDPNLYHPMNDALYTYFMLIPQYIASGNELTEEDVNFLKALLLSRTLFYEDITNNPDFSEIITREKAQIILEKYVAMLKAVESDNQDYFAEAMPRFRGQKQE